MGTDTNLVRATKTAVREAIAFLQTERSTACDVEITQLVDGTLGAHVMIRGTSSLVGDGHRTDVACCLVFVA